ncbi:MAG: glutamate--tRNA ligase [Candidatus Micrarchaeia archaeon]
MKIEESILKYALKNAADFGKAEKGAVIGKVIAEHPEAKIRMGELIKQVEKTVNEVNSMDMTTIKEMLAAYTFEKKKEEEKKIRLEGAMEGSVVTRFLPEPNGYLHIGHAKAAFLSYEASRQYKGRCLLRFDDTNPEKESQEFVDGIKEDLAWLGLNFDGESYASDMMPTFYKCAVKLIEQGDAYVCLCPRDTINKHREEGRECECRSRSVEENMELWGDMLFGAYDAGDAILRLKGDMSSANTVMRDPTLFRIIYERHYRQGEKYIVWPTYDFEVCIADSIEGVTHALRSKEYELRDELYYYILDRLGMRKPAVYDFARLNLKGTKLSKRFLKPLVEEGMVQGWDDPRMPTIRGLKRRGITAHAIREFVLYFGLSKTESEPSWDLLFAENRKFLDPLAERYFFVPNPVKIKVENAPQYEVSLAKHPERGMGFRKFKTGNLFHIPASDWDSVNSGDIFRLKDLYNVRVVDKEKCITDYAGDAVLESTKKIQWVSEEYIEAEVAVIGDLFIGEDFNPESMKVESGFCEASCSELEIGKIVQFERYGFCRLDKKEEKKLFFILANR